MDDALFFQPWIGDDYARVQQGNVDAPVTAVSQPETWAYPCHVLGESHYGEQDEYAPAFTRSLVQKCGFSTDQGKCSAFFAKVLKIVSGKELYEIDRRMHWQKLAFSNYIQDLLNKQRRSPDDAQWDRARAAFYDQLRLTTPEILVVLGRRLWAHLPTQHSIALEPMILPSSMFPHLSDAYGTDVSVDEARAYVYEAGAKRRVTIAVYVLHPSGRGFDWRKAARRVNTARVFFSNVVLDRRVEDCTPA